MSLFCFCSVLGGGGFLNFYVRLTFPRKRCECVCVCGLLRFYVRLMFSRKRCVFVRITGPRSDDDPPSTLHHFPFWVHVPLRCRDLTSRAWGWQLNLETSILIGFFALSVHGSFMDVAMLPRGRDQFSMVLKLCISGWRHIKNNMIYRKTPMRFLSFHKTTPTVFFTPGLGSHWVGSGMM